MVACDLLLSQQRPPGRAGTGPPGAAADRGHHGEDPELPKVGSPDFPRSPSLCWKPLERASDLPSGPRQALARQAQSILEFEEEPADLGADFSEDRPEREDGGCGA